MTATPFLVIGAMKSGTTTIQGILQQLDVELVAEKETSSFLDRATAAGASDRVRASSAAAAGEVSTAYMQRPSYTVDPAIAREFLGSDARLIAVLRDPFERARSHWRHWSQLGRNSDGAVEDLLAAPEGAYVQFSSYYRQLEPWLETFGEDAILPLRLEDYADHSRGWHSDIVGHLGLPEESVSAIDVVHLNSGETRVVARGWGTRVARSSLYRRVRPLIPSRVRGVGAMTLGGRRGGFQNDPASSDLRDRFHAVIASDQRQLRQTWPHLEWEN